MHKLSIVIPVYNGAKTIGRCLDSIWQSGLREDEYEVVCVNDCSTDNTLEVLAQIQENHPNLRVVTNAENVRAGGSRNHGVKIAQGDYVCFIDSDDYYHPGSLSKAYETAVNENLDILFCDSCRELEGGKPSGMTHCINNTSVMSGVDFMEHYPIPLAPWKYIFKRNLMVDNNIYFAEKITAEDGDWVCRITMAAQLMKYMPIVLVHYVLMADSVTAKVSFRSAVDVLMESKRIADLYKSHKLGSLSRIADGQANDGVKRYLLCMTTTGYKAKVLKETLTLDNYTGKAKLAKKWPWVYALASNILMPFVSLGLKTKRIIKGRM